MKYVKALGLVAIASAVLVALVGASSASATVICETTPTGGGSGTTGTTCPEGWSFPGGAVLHAGNIGKISWHTSFKTVECNKSTLQGTTENLGSATETVKGPVEALTFEECNCEVKVLRQGTMELHWIPDTSNGTATGNGQEVTTTCSTIFGNVHCIYATENTDLGEVTAPVAHGPAVLHIHFRWPRKATNALCNEESTFTATYELTSPSPLWLADHT